MTFRDILATECTEWRNDPNRALMLTGERYYLNRTDISRIKAAKVTNVTVNRSNHLLEYPFLRELVDQKIGYMMSKSPTISPDEDDDAYQTALDTVLDRRFLETFANCAKDAVNKGISYLYVGFDELGKLAVSLIPGEQGIPLWADDAHTRMEGFLRMYDTVKYSGVVKSIVTKVDFFSPQGIEHYVYESGALREDTDRLLLGGEVKEPYFRLGEEAYNWDRVPIIAVKYNHEEQPLLALLKSLVDNYNEQDSVNADLLADLPNYFYILENYGGTDLANFLNDLNLYRAIKVQSDGDVRKLQAEPNTASVETMLDSGRRAIYQFGRGVSAEAIGDSGNTTNLKIKALFANLDMDCNIFEVQIQRAFEQLMWFVGNYFVTVGAGDYRGKPATLTLNRDIIISESEVINDCRNSVGIISQQTIVTNHPWVANWLEERTRLEAEQDDRDEYAGAFEHDKPSGE